MKPQLPKVSRPIRLLLRLSLALLMMSALSMLLSWVCGPYWIAGVLYLILDVGIALLILVLIPGLIGLGICNYFTWLDAQKDEPRIEERGGLWG